MGVVPEALLLFQTQNPKPGCQVQTSSTETILMAALLFAALWLKKMRRWLCVISIRANFCLADYNIVYWVSVFSLHLYIFGLSEQRLQSSRVVVKNWKNRYRILPAMGIVVLRTCPFYEHRSVMRLIVTQFDLWVTWRERMCSGRSAIIPATTRFEELYVHTELHPQS